LWQYDSNEAESQECETLGGSMTVKKIEFQSMSVDELWSFFEEITSVLSARIKAQKYDLERRLALLNRGTDVVSRPRAYHSFDGKQRRKYPRVLPKYRNPQTSETWTGRGKCPRWLVAAMASGHRIEEFRIEGEGASPTERLIGHLAPA
jgi:DNA-binding protein H-NS